MTDQNPIYSLFGVGKTLDPIDGEYSITTFNRYKSGKYHGSEIGVSIDLGTSKQNHPLYTLQNETLLLTNNPLKWANVSDQNKGYGYHLKTYTDAFETIYGHMQNNTYSSNTLSQLINSGANANLYRFTLPSGYNIGRVGNTGNSEGEHLHYELRRMLGYTK